MPTKTKRALAKAQKAPQIKGASLAAVIKAEVSKPVVPGETIFGTGDVEAFKGRATKELTVSNVGDRPIQVGSHLNRPIADVGHREFLCRTAFKRLHVAGAKDGFARHDGLGHLCFDHSGQGGSLYLRSLLSLGQGSFGLRRHVSSYTDMKQVGGFKRILTESGCAPSPTWSRQETSLRLETRESSPERPASHPCG